LFLYFLGGGPAPPVRQIGRGEGQTPGFLGLFLYFLGLFLFSLPFFLFSLPFFLFSWALFFFLFLVFPMTFLRLVLFRSQGLNFYRIQVDNPHCFLDTNNFL